MRSPLLGALGLAACTVLAACSDQDSPVPAEPRPEFSHIGSTTCNLNFSPLIAQYFVQPRQGVVQNLAQQMGTDFAADKKTEVQAGGFAILANIEAAVNEGESIDAVTGSTLANRVLECMFTDAELTGVSLPIPLTEELTIGGLGAFGVRGGGTAFDTSGPVVAHDGFSATAPPSGSDWSESLLERVLIYGSRPNSTTESYDWDKVRPAVEFTDPPGIVVALCAGTSVSLLQEDGSFVPYVDGDFMEGLCGQPLSALDARRARSGWGVLSLASRLVNLLRPGPAYAAAVFSHGTTAGKTAYSHFTLGEVPSVTLQFLKEPVNPVVNQICCATGVVRVLAYETDDATPLPGVTITLVTKPTTNKGKNAEVVGNVATTGPDGVATFSALTFLKSGVYKQEATGKIDDPLSPGPPDRAPTFVTDISAAFTVGGH